MIETSRRIACGVAAALLCTIASAADTGTSADAIRHRLERINANTARTLYQATAIQPKAATVCPTPSPFPTEPPVGTPSASFVGTDFDDQFSAVVWRWTCPTNSAQSMIFMRVTPISNGPFVCSGDFTVIANGAQQDARLLQSGSSSSFCGNLYVPTTLEVGNWSFDPTFDRNAAIKLVYDGYPTDSVATLAAYASSPAPITPVVGLWWNPSESGSGYVIDYHNGVMIAVVFSYKTNGDAEWYLAEGPLLNGGRSFTAALTKYRNGQCISCAYKGEPTPAGNDGSISITFTSATTAVATLPGGRTINIVPQVW